MFLHQLSSAIVYSHHLHSHNQAISSSLDKHVVYEAEFLPIKQIASYPDNHLTCLIYT